MIIEKCKHRNEEGEWDGENAVWHISLDGKKTLCGKRIGSEKQGWFRWSHPTEIATCPECKKELIV